VTSPSPARPPPPKRKKERKKATEQASVWFGLGFRVTNSEKDSSQNATNETKK